MIFHKSIALGLHERVGDRVFAVLIHRLANQEKFTMSKTTLTVLDAPATQNSTNFVPNQYYEYFAGTLRGAPYVRRDSISSFFDTVDTTLFFFNGGNFNASLTGIRPGTDIDMRLIRDNNNNGIVDSFDTIIASSLRGSNADEAINVNGLAAGRYFLQSYLYSGPGSTYTLRMSNTRIGGNLLPVETNVGILRGFRQFSDSLYEPGEFGNGSRGDAADTFQFSVAGLRFVNITLSGLSADADLRLVQDRNRNGVIDIPEIIAESTNAGTSPDSVTAFLGTGTYFAQVYLYSGTSTGYTLSFS